MDKYQVEIEQVKISIVDKHRLKAKLQDEIEQYHTKINRADQHVSILKSLILNSISILDQTYSPNFPRHRTK